MSKSNSVSSGIITPPLKPNIQQLQQYPRTVAVAKTTQVPPKSTPKPNVDKVDFGKPKLTASAGTYKLPAPKQTSSFSPPSTTQSK